MKEIILTKGRIALVDDEDYEWLNQYKWCYAGLGYAYRNINKIPDTMHRQIMIHHGYDINGLAIDHRNRNKTDNQKNNLRIATPAQNSANSDKRKRNTSGYKGVSWSKDHKSWEIYITENNKRKHLGFREDLIEAAKVYDIAAIKYHGEFASLNFPDDIPTDLEIKPRNKIIFRNNTSGYRGVSFKRASKKWLAEFQLDGKKMNLGLFETPQEAARIYNQTAIKYLGEKAKLNDIPSR